MRVFHIICNILIKLILLTFFYWLDLNVFRIQLMLIWNSVNSVLIVDCCDSSGASHGNDNLFDICYINKRY